MIREGWYKMGKKKGKKMLPLKPLLPEQLKYTCVQLEGTDKVVVDPNNNEIYNQERGAAALEFVLGVENSKTHAILVGPKNSGRKFLVEKIIKKITAGNERELMDLILFHNFKDETAPKSVFLPKGAGKEFKKAIESMPKILEHILPLAFRSNEYKERVEKIFEEKDLIEKDSVKKMNKIIEKHRCVMVKTDKGFLPTNVSFKNNGAIMGDAEFNSQTPDVQQALDKAFEKALEETSGERDELNNIYIAVGDSLKKIKEIVCENQINSAFFTLKKSSFRLFNEQCRGLEKKRDERTEKLKQNFENEAKKLGFVLVPNMKITENEFNPFCFNIVESAKKENEQKESEETEKEKINKAVKLVAGWSEEYEKICKEFRDEYIKAEENAKKQPDENRDKIFNFMCDLEEYCLKNIDLFLEKLENQKPQQQVITIGVSEESKKEKALKCFEINLLVDNTSAKHPIIIDEKEVKFSKLFGEVNSKEERIGIAPGTMSIKAGDFLKANGGYLLLDLYDVCVEHAFQKIISTLKAGKFEFESKLDNLGLSSHSIKPEPMPINLKVVFIAEEWVWGALEGNSDFSNMFIPAFFNKETKLDEKAVEDYLKFAVGCCKAKNLMPFDGSAVAKLVEFGCRLAESNKKTSVQFGLIKKLMIEADYWAKKNNNSRVSAECVKTALKERKKRLSFYEERYQEQINDGIKLIDTSGKKVGRINGLSVYQISEDIMFGLPLKITCQSYAGEKGIVSVQRNIGMAGTSHNMAMEIIEAYILAKYGKSKPIGLSAKISFEQCYGGSDGDSASLAKLLTVLSSVSNLPLKQSFAITGSMSQFGEAQPIGGVNQKVEGFFDVMKARGLSDNCGVIIPNQNINDLVLKDEVIEAVKNNKFKIYPIGCIDEAIEIFFELPAEEVHKTIIEKLENKLENKKVSASLSLLRKFIIKFKKEN